MNKPETPKLECKGCIARQRIIDRLAKKIEELEKLQDDKLTKLRRVL
jgi:hypothetical protein